MSELKLIFDEPKLKVKAPVHLADMSKEERNAKCEELGIPAFRSNQVAVHYFTHLNNQPDTWSDIPADLRQKLADTFTPKLMQFSKLFY